MAMRRIGPAIVVIVLVCALAGCGEPDPNGPNARANNAATAEASQATSTAVSSQTAINPPPARPTASVSTAPALTTTSKDATALAAIVGPERKAVKIYSGPDAVIKQPQGALLFTQADLGPSFQYLGGAPQVTIYSPSEWQAFEWMAAQPEPKRGLSSINLTINHDVTAGKSQALLPGDVTRTANGDADGVHRRVSPSDARPGVTYLRLISDQGGFWYASYDAIFAVGRNRNVLSVLVNIDGPTDRVFGYTGLNSFIDQIASREQVTP